MGRLKAYSFALVIFCCVSLVALFMMGDSPIVEREPVVVDIDPETGLVVRERSTYGSSFRSDAVSAPKESSPVSESGSEPSSYSYTPPPVSESGSEPSSYSYTPPPVSESCRLYNGYIDYGRVSYRG